MEVGKIYFVVGVIFILISSTFPISTSVFTKLKEESQPEGMVKIIVGISSFKINNNSNISTLHRMESHSKRNLWKINRDILPLYEVNITTEKFNTLLEELRSTKEEIKTSKNYDESKNILERKLGLFRKLGILPYNFTLNNLINISIALRKSLISFLKDTYDIPIPIYLTKNNIQTMGGPTGDSPGLLKITFLTSIIPITLLGMQLPYGKLMPDKRDIDHDGNTTEPLVISFNHSANAPLISALESLFRGEQVSWIRKSEFGLSAMEWEILLVPSITSFTYVIGFLGWGKGIDTLFPKKFIVGSAVFVQLEAVGFTITLVAQQIKPTEGVLQFPLIDLGILASLISAWSEVVSPSDK